MNSTHSAQSSDDAALNRREFLGRGVRFTIAVAVGPACLSGATSAEAAGPLVKFSHGTGLCNMPLFYAGETKLFAKYGANAEVDAVSEGRREAALKPVEVVVQRGADRPTYVREIRARGGTLARDS